MSNKQDAAMFNEWKLIAEAASRVNAVSACDEALNIARDHGINISIVPGTPVRPTCTVGGKPVAISISPRLFTRSPEFTVTVSGNTYPVKDLLKAHGYWYSELGWRKQFKLGECGDGDEAIVQALLSAIEEALFILAELKARG
jgi:hypothetical protein